MDVQADRQIGAGPDQRPTWKLRVGDQPGRRLARLEATVGRLPFRRGSIASVRVGSSLRHLPAPQLPVVLAHLHDAIAVGGSLGLSLATTQFDSEEATNDLMTGAGFAVDALARRRGLVDVTATRLLTLPDFVAPNLRILVCGLNPSVYSAEIGFGFARGTNRFWRAAAAARLMTSVRQPLRSLELDGVGMTDMVKRATARSSELSVAEYRAGATRVQRVVDWLDPALVLFVGLEGWRAAVDRTATPGLQPSRFGSALAYVMPSTSGLNARTSLAELVAHMAAAVDLVPTRAVAT